MSNEIEKRDEQQSLLLRMLTSPGMKAEIARALPKHVTPERMARVALTALRSTRGLDQCTPASFLACIMQASQLGLEVNTPLGHAYLIPYKGQCTLILGYQGMMDLAWRSDRVGTIRSVPVFADDVFSYEEGLAPTLVHRPKLDGRHDPELLRYVYAVATIKGSDERVFVVLTKADVERARSRSMASSKGPWVTDYVAMAQKTAIRRLYKLLPKSIEMARASALDEAPEIGISQTFDPAIHDALTSDAAKSEGVGPVPDGGALEAEAASVEDVPRSSARSTVAKAAASLIGDKRPADEKRPPVDIAAGEDPSDGGRS